MRPSSSHTWNHVFQAPARPRRKDRGLIEPQSGWGVCPVCKGGVKLVGWQGVMNHLASGFMPKPERVPRVGRHAAGGGPSGGRTAVACLGSYAIPERVEP